MPADGLTKAGVTNGALQHLIKTGHFTSVQEQAMMQQRSAQATSEASQRWKPLATRWTIQPTRWWSWRVLEQLVPWPRKTAVGKVSQRPKETRDRPRWRTILQRRDGSAHSWNHPSNRRKATSRYGPGESTRRGPAVKILSWSHGQHSTHIRKRQCESWASCSIVCLRRIAQSQARAVVSTDCRQLIWFDDTSSHPLKVRALLAIPHVLGHGLCARVTHVFTSSWQSDRQDLLWHLFAPLPLHSTCPGIVWFLSYEPTCRFLF